MCLHDFWSKLSESHQMLPQFIITAHWYDWLALYNSNLSAIIVLLGAMQQQRCWVILYALHECMHDMFTQLREKATTEETK